MDTSVNSPNLAPQEVYDRLNQAVRWLCFVLNLESQKALAGLINYTESTLSQILSARQPVTNRFLGKLSGLRKDLNTDWIMNGEGEMVTGKAENSAKLSEAQELFANQQNIVKNLQEQLPAILERKNDALTEMFLGQLQSAMSVLEELSTRVKGLERESFAFYWNSSGSGNIGSDVTVGVENKGRRRGRPRKDSKK